MEINLTFFVQILNIFVGIKLINLICVESIKELVRNEKKLLLLEIKKEEEHLKAITTKQLLIEENICTEENKINNLYLNAKSDFDAYLQKKASQEIEKIPLVNFINDSSKELMDEEKHLLIASQLVQKLLEH